MPHNQHQHNNPQNGITLPTACIPASNIVGVLNVTAYKNDTFGGINFEVIVNETPKDLTNTAIKMQVRYRETDGVLLHEASIGSGITLTDAANGAFRVDAFLVNFVSGLHLYDIQFTDTETRTFVRGNFLVLSDVTQ